MSTRSQRLLRSLVSLLFLATLGGCLKVKEHLTLNADGSGSVQIEVFCAVAPEALRSARYRSSFARLEQSGHTVYPPLMKEHVQELFPGKDFTIETTEGTGQDDAPTLKVTVTFKDINALIASPYGAAHSLWLRKAGGKLEFAVQSGLAGAVALTNSDQAYYMLRRERQDTGKMSAEFTVTLPNTLDGVDGRSTAWTIARADAKGDPVAELEMFTRPLRAVCSAEGVAFSPASPPRLELLPFNDLPAGPADGMPKPPTRQQVTAAATYRPHYLKSVRAFYLPGRGPERDEHGGQRHYLERSGLTVVGPLTLPAALKPDRWGTPVVDEARDDLGTNLLVGNEGMGGQTRTTPWDSAFQNEFGKSTAEEEHHILRLTVNAPPPQAKKLVLLRGAAQLEYDDDFLVVKLPNAIPADWVQRMTPEGRRVGGVRGRNTIESADLARLGIELRVLTVEQQMSHGREKRPRTRFWLSASNRNARIVSLQAYDVRGRPWPKINWAGHITSRVEPLHFSVPLHAEPPYSLALLVSANTVKMRVPVTVENFSLERTREETK